MDGAHVGVRAGWEVRNRVVDVGGPDRNLAFEHGDPSAVVDHEAVGDRVVPVVEAQLEPPSRRDQLLRVEVDGERRQLERPAPSGGAVTAPGTSVGSAAASLASGAAVAAGATDPHPATADAARRRHARTTRRSMTLVQPVIVDETRRASWHAVERQDHPSECGGSAWESNPPRDAGRRATGFEDRGAHRDPSAPAER